MIARGFRSVLWVATVGGAALSCYMVSLKVATERNELARVENEIIAAKRDIRALQTELGTRGRLSQLEQWNAEVLALSAPKTAQFMKSEFTLARLDQTESGVAERTRAEVRMAALETEPASAAKPAAPVVVAAVAATPAPRAETVAPLVHRAGFVEPAPARPKPEASAAKPRAEPPKPRLDAKLAAEIGAAARQEEDEGSDGN